MDALIADYVAGTLPKPAKTLLDAHLELSGTNASFAMDLDHLAGIALEQVKPHAVSNASAMLDTIFGSEDGDDMHVVTAAKAVAWSSDKRDWMPVALRALIGMDAEDIPWRTKLPGFKVFNLAEIDGCEASLYRIKPGMAIPTHTHEGRELTLVLKGGFSDCDGHYKRGDISIADEAVDHRPITDLDEECICFAVTEAPLRFANPVTRLISSILP